MRARVKATGKIIEVSWRRNIITSCGVEKQYVDNNCEWCTYVQSELEFIKEEPQKDIDWEQRRYEIAKDMMAAFLSNSCSNVYMGNPDEQAKCAIMFVDALISELKKGGSDGQTAE